MYITYKHALNLHLEIWPIQLRTCLRERERNLYRCYPSPCRWFVSPFIFAGVWGRVHARRVRERPPLYPVNARRRARGRGEERRRRRRRRPHRYGVANGEIQPATETVIPSPYCSLSSLPFHQERLCFSISDSSPRLLYLEFIWCGSSGA